MLHYVSTQLWKHSASLCEVFWDPQEKTKQYLKQQQ